MCGVGKRSRFSIAPSQRLESILLVLPVIRPSWGGLCEGEGKIPRWHTVCYGPAGVYIIMCVLWVGDKVASVRCALLFFVNFSCSEVKSRFFSIS